MTHGVGLDIGTMNIVAARQESEDKVRCTTQRDAFLDLERSAKPMLKMNKVPFIEFPDDDKMYVLGDAALKFANVFKRDLRRPLSQGLISNTDLEGRRILQEIIARTIQPPIIPNEVCYFSIPGNPVDLPNRDNVFHRGVFEMILRGLGYRPVASNEAQAVIFAECADSSFSGVALSFGAGMVNVSCVYQTQVVPELQFAVAKSGDYIDAQSAQNLGMTATAMCALKESGVDLMNPTTPQEQALTFYYQEVIRYALEHITNRYRSVGGAISFPEPVPMVIAGGTAKAKGFLELFKKEFDLKKRNFPIPISEIRLATDALNAVAQGLLIQAQLED